MVVFLARHPEVDVSSLDDNDKTIVHHAMEMSDVPSRFALYPYVVFFKSFRLQMSL